MISVGGLQLSDDLIWENEFDSPGLAQSVRPTLLGRQVVQSAPRQGGREVVLQASQEGSNVYGYFTRGQAQALKAMEEAGEPVSFVYGAQQFQVVIKAGGLNVRPLQPTVEQLGGDYYVGSLTMIEV